MLLPVLLLNNCQALRVDILCLILGSHVICINIDFMMLTAFLFSILQC